MLSKQPKRGGKGKTIKNEEEEEGKQQNRGGGGGGGGGKIIKLWRGE